MHKKPCLVGAAVEEVTGAGEVEVEGAFVAVEGAGAIDGGAVVSKTIVVESFPAMVLCKRFSFILNACKLALSRHLLYLGIFVYIFCYTCTLSGIHILNLKCEEKKKVGPTM